MKRTWIIIVLLLAVPVMAAEPAEPAPHVGWTTGVLTNASLDQMEARVGYELDADWELGLLGTWFTEDLGGAEFGLGGYLTRTVDPAASFPFADVLPGIGDWLSLPDSVICQTYLIGKIQVVPYDGNAEIVGALGAGAQIGPATVEWVYHLVEQGEMASPVLASGAQLFFGARLEF